MRFLRVYQWTLALLVLSCSPSVDESDGPMPNGPQFHDVATEVGIVHKMISGTPEKEHIVECNTGGAALFDYDEDGDLDIFLVNGSRLQGFPKGEEPRAALFRNDGIGSLSMWGSRLVLHISAGAWALLSSIITPTD